MYLTESEKRALEAYRKRKEAERDTNSAVIGGVVGAVTDSGIAGALAGGLLGGSIIGGVLGGLAGDFLNGGSVDD